MVYLINTEHSKFSRYWCHSIEYHNSGTKVLEINECKVWLNSISSYTLIASIDM